jgi:hypothetical protein
MCAALYSWFGPLRTLSEVSAIRLGQRAAVYTREWSRRRDVYPRGQLHDFPKGNSHQPQLSVMSPPACISGAAENGVTKFGHRMNGFLMFHRLMWFCGSVLAMGLTQPKQSTGIQFCNKGVLLA